jgi:hypothetical protein
MALSNRDPFAETCTEIKTFPDHVVLDIARNDAAPRPYRLLAVEILQVRKSPLIKHPDIQFLVSELEIELDGIVFEHPAPGPGALKASVTTETMFADGPIISNTESGEEGGAGEGAIVTLSTESETTTSVLSENRQESSDLLQKEPANVA